MTATSKARKELDRALEELEAARQAEQAALAKLTSLRRPPGSSPSARRSAAALAAEATAAREHEEARHATWAVEAAASRALDAYERAEGDSLALACDPEALCAELAPMIEAEERLRAELSEIERSRVAAVTAAQRAHEAVQARRTGAGQRLPVAPPPAGVDGLGGSTHRMPDPRPP